MKRVALILALLCVVGFALPVYALGRITIFESINDSGEELVYEVPTTTIVPGSDRIVGITVMTYDDTANAELWVSISDAVPDGDGGTVAEVIGEAEAIDENVDSEWYPYPLAVNTQLVIKQGANTAVLVYYAR